MHDLLVYIRGVLLFRYTCNCRCKVAKYFVFLHARIQRGGGGGGAGVRAPPSLPEIFILFLLLFSGLLRSPVLNIVLKFEKSESPPSSKGLSLLPSPVKHTIPGFHESAISMFILSKIIRFYIISTKVVLEKDPIPAPLSNDITCTFYKAKTIISNVFYMEEKRGM